MTLSWHEVYMGYARLIAEKSHSESLKVGAIIVSDDNSQVLAQGYNGDYRGSQNIPESLEPGQSGWIHAEQNAIIKMDFNFHKPKRLYCTHSACRMCSKMIIQACISTVIYDIEYRDTSGLDIMRSCGIKVISLKEVIEEDMKK